MNSASPAVPSDTLQRALAEWERLWGAPGLTDSLSISFSRRLRRSLGRAVPARGRVVLHEALQYAAPARLREVLCHEVAHIVVARRAATAGFERPRAHGPEWAELVTAAGYRPIITADGGAVVYAAPTRSKRVARARTSRPWVVHTCPVCHMERLARRHVSAWRCAACVANGLPGELVVSRRTRGTPGEDTDRGPT